MNVIASDVPVTRRGIVLGSGAAGLTMVAGRRAFAADANVIKIGYVSPRTGALAAFGQTDPYILDLARKALAKGIGIGGQTYEVRILDRDTQSDPSRASQLAKGLIESDGVDLMLSIATPETVNPVSDACEAAGVPSLSTIMPWEAWYFGRGAKPGAPSPFKWSYLFCFGSKEFSTSYLSAWGSLPTNKKVGVLYPNDADGNAVRAHLAPVLAKGGYQIIDPGPYEDGTSDYSAQIALFKKEHCEIFNGFPLPPDFAAFWRQAAQQGYTRIVKICQVAKTGLFPAEMQALGSLSHNIAVGAYWHKVFPYSSSLTGLSGPDLASGFEAATGRMWTQELGAAMSLVDAGIATLTSSGMPHDKSAVVKALASLKTETMIGKIDFTNGPVANVSASPIVGCQWIQSAPGSKFPLDLVVTENADDRKVPIQQKMVPYRGKA